jgi:hypothetical protein
LALPAKALCPRPFAKRESDRPLRLRGENLAGDGQLVESEGKSRVDRHLHDQPADFRGPLFRAPPE